jgi:hypothetical protein
LHAFFSKKDYSVYVDLEREVALTDIPEKLNFLRLSLCELPPLLILCVIEAGLITFLCKAFGLSKWTLLKFFPFWLVTFGHGRGISSGDFKIIIGKEI